jgi:IclR family acetate operon transcriptional repressor
MRIEAEGDAIGVLDRVTSILEAFDEDDRGLGISELAVRADLPKSTVSRLVSTLVRQRYLEREGKLIHLGIRLFELGQLADAPRELRTAALPVMADLRGATGENVSLAIRDGHEMVFVAVMRGHASRTRTARIGGRVAAHATATGKAVMAYDPDLDLDAFAAEGLVALTPLTVVDAAVLGRQLAEIRGTGHAVEVGESVPDVVCIASPVLSPSGRPVAAISVSGHVDSFSPDRVEALVGAAALALARRLAA